MRRKIFVYMLAFVIVFSAVGYLAPVEVNAKTLAQLQKEQKELKEKQDNAKKAIENSKTNQEKINSEIQSLDSELSLAQNELEMVQQQLLDSQEKLEESQTKLEVATIEKEEQSELFSQRIKYIHENGSIGYLKVLIESKSFNDFLTRLQYVNDIMKYDNETLDRLRTVESVIKIQTDSIEKETLEIEVLVEEQTIKNAALETKKSEKGALYEKYQQDEENYKDVLASTEEASNEVQRLINQAMAAQSSSGGSKSYTVYYTGGQLEWPVPGKYYISSGYGYRQRPIGSGTEFHTGIDIPAAYGSNVIASEGGTVITSSYVNGYGYTVIINHGNGLTTLYGHNSSLVVSAGETVSRGQVIAKVGSTGNSTGNHVHFEVRLNGSHVSPNGYLGV